MPYYEILSSPLSPLLPTQYKGLYRATPYPKNEHDRILPLWKLYAQAGDARGITNQLSLGQLRRLVWMASSPKESFEVILFDDLPYNNSLHPTRFYGIDVVGTGGYSAIFDVLFSPKNTASRALFRENFLPLLNENILFPSRLVSERFLAALNDERALYETENWSPVYIYGI